MMPVTSASLTPILLIWLFFRPCPPATLQPIQTPAARPDRKKEKARRYSQTEEAQRPISLVER